MGLAERGRRGGVVTPAPHGVHGVQEASSGLHGQGWGAGGRGPPGAGAQAFRLLVLLVLHASVLEPDLDLPLGQVEQVGHLHAPGPAQVAVEVELLLQLHQLSTGVGGARPLGGGRGATRGALLPATATLASASSSSSEC